MYQQVIKALKSEADPEKAKIFLRFFKTGKGEYGEGDKFLGLTVPVQRSIAKRFYKEVSLKDLARLLGDKFHEYRFTALEMLVMKYEASGTRSEKKALADFYLLNAKGINNWDLVDTSAPYVLGDYLFECKAKPEALKLLMRLAGSPNVWERRIAMLACFAYIKQDVFDIPLAIAERLMNDVHDLMHKAVGWMLRELGKRDLKREEAFLKKYASRLPRTLLRYAIEKLPPERRAYYLSRKDALESAEERIDMSE